jgi:hypothetical protein
VGAGRAIVAAHQRLLIADHLHHGDGRRLLGRAEADYNGGAALSEPS